MKMELRSSLMIIALFSLSHTKKTEMCSSCALRKHCNQIVLFDGGFTGQIHRNCNNTNDSLISTGCNASAVFHNSTCILSIDTESCNWTKTNCCYSNSGVWLLKNNENRTFQIKITRNSKLRPEKPVCFVRGYQTWNETSGLLRDCIKPAQPNVNSASCGNITCVDPNTVCKEAKYKKCSENDTNHDIVNITGASPECFKCGTAFQETEGNINIPNFTLPNNDPNSNTSFLDTVKNMNKMVLKLMENKSSVSVCLNDVKGILVKQQKAEDIKAFYFMYSNETNFRIIEDQTQLMNFNRTFLVPKEAFESASNISVDILFASLLQFPSFPQDHKESMLLNNEVYSIDMGTEISNLNNTFNLTFGSIRSDNIIPVCSSWNGQGVSPNWTTDGCNTSYINGSVTCSCHHLTFFAVLMSYPPSNISTSDLNSLTYLTSIGCGLSLFFLSVGLFMHFLLRRGQASVSVHILINLFLVLFLLNLSFLVNESVANTGNDIGCKLMAGIMHYFMLSAFTWFGLQALHLCLHLTLNVASIQNYIIKMYIAGWVPPALVVIAIFLSHKYGQLHIISDTGKTVSMCWIIDSTVHQVVNICYYSAIFLFTFLTFVVMLRWLYLLRRKSPTTKISRKRVRPSDALTIMGLFCILGLSWGFAFFAYGPMQIPAYYIFSILNSCQGVFLFVYYYNSSRMVGGAETLTEEDSSSTVVENPYNKPKSS